MSDYIFNRQQVEQELQRLRMIQELFDATTIGHLERTGIQAGWRCLELGAGAGSILRWMSRVAGTEGRVVGVDRDTVHLHDISGPSVQIIEGDFLEIPIETGFDLAHCRYVLIHNRHSDEMLHKLSGTLKPGGCLVVEEPDFTSARLLNSHEDDSGQRVNNAICRLFEEMELNPGYGLILPARVVAAGLEIVSVDSRIHLDRGGSRMARMMAASLRALADRYIATGAADPTDVEQYRENTEDESRWAVYYSTVSVVARKQS